MVVGFLHSKMQQKMSPHTAALACHTTKKSQLYIITRSSLNLAEYAVLKSIAAAVHYNQLNSLPYACFTVQQGSASVLAVCLLSLEESTRRCKE